MVPVMSTAPDTFQQISREAAESYEAAFVPALFAGLARELVRFAGVGRADRVLDVACGTGIVARTAADVTGPDGRIVGIDLNEAMLTVARRVRPELSWRQGDAAALPFVDASFDAVLCQSGLMFVPDVVAALREMARVVAADGVVAVQVWSGLDRQVGFRPLADAVSRHAGRDGSDLIGTYFRLGDRAELAGMFRRAGLAVREVRTMPITVHAPSIDDYVTGEVESTPLAARIDDDTYRRIRTDAAVGLADFCDSSGALTLPFEVLLLAATRADQLPSARTKIADL